MGGALLIPVNLLTLAFLWLLPAPPQGQPLAASSIAAPLPIAETGLGALDQILAARLVEEARRRGVEAVLPAAEIRAAAAAALSDSGPAAAALIAAYEEAFSDIGTPLESL